MNLYEKEFKNNLPDIKSNFIESEKEILLRIFYLQNCIDELEKNLSDNWHTHIKNIMSRIDNGKISKEEGYRILETEECIIKQYKNSLEPSDLIIYSIAESILLTFDELADFTGRITSNVKGNEIL